MQSTSSKPAVCASVYGGVIATAGGREVESRHKGDLTVALYSSPPYDLHVPAMAVSRLSINLTDSVVSGHVEGQRRRRFESRRHSLFFTPAGASAHWQKERPSRHINIYFEPDALQQAEGVDFMTIPLLNGALPSTGVLVERLATELMQSGPFAVEAADSLARLIVIQLARRQLAACNEGLTTALRARINDFIDANLGRRLLISELAHAAGLPPSRFAQAFTRSAGMAPHQYVLQRRVERAGNLLRHSTLPLVDVAAICGFSSQQHMTRLVRQRLGTTPGRARDASDLHPGASS